jgi:four helix bundle protein
MVLQLRHTQTDVFKALKAFTLGGYRLTKDFPAVEKFSMVEQIRRAALSTHLNIAEGCTPKSEAGRKRFVEIARSPVVEVDTTLDIACGLHYKSAHQRQKVGTHIDYTFKQLSGLIR